MLFKKYRASCVQLHIAMMNLLQYAAPPSLGECGEKLGKALGEISQVVEILEAVIKKLPEDLAHGSDGKAPIVQSEDVKNIIALSLPVIDRFDEPDLYQSFWAVELFGCQMQVLTEVMSFYVAWKGYSEGDYKTLPSNIDSLNRGLVDGDALVAVD